MPATVNHVLSATTPDSTQEIRPSHWNSAHAVSLSLASNEVLKWISAGADSISSGTIAFSNSNGVSFGISTSTNGGTITASHNALTSQSNQAFSAQGGSSAFQTLAFSNQNNVTFSNSAGQVVASASFAQSNQSLGVFGSSNTTGQSSSSSLDARSVSLRGVGAISIGLSGGEVLFSVPALAVSAAGASASAGTMVFSNSNSVSFGQAGSTITASVSQSNQRISAFAVSNTTQSSSGTLDAAALSFAGAGVASVGVTNGSIVISVPSGGGAGDGGVGISAGASSVSSGNVIFSNSNGISFGLNGSTLTASYTVPTQSADSVGIYGSSQTTGQSSSSTVDIRSISFVGQGLLSVGLSAGSILLSATQSNQAASAANGSFAFQTLSFSNTNGVSFGTSAGSAITASIAAQTNQIITVVASSNTTAQSSSNTMDARSFTVRGAGIISVGMSGQELVVSASAAGAADGFNILAAGTQTAATNTTVVFSNSNGVSFGMSGSSRITASVISTVGIYGSSNTTGQSSSSTYDARSLSIIGAGIISIGQSNGSIQISAPDAVDFTQLSVGVSTGGNTAGDTGVFTGRLVLAGGANITLSGSSNAGSYTVSVIGGAGGGGAGISAGTQSVNSGTVVFSNSNNVSFGMSGSSRVTASYAFNLSAGTTSNNLNVITFSNSNGVSFGLNGSTVTASFSQTNQTLGLFATGNTTQNSSTTFDARTLGTMNGLGAMTVGFSNGSIQLSAPATSSLSATGLVSISSNGSTISIGVANATTESGFNPSAGVQFSLSQVGQASLLMQPAILPNVQYDRVVLPIFNTNSTLSSGSHTLSFWLGIYTRNVSTLSLVGSTSGSTAVTHSGTQGSYSLFSGMRHFTIGSTTTLTAGRYWLGFVSRTTSGGADGSYSNVIQSIAPGTVASVSHFGLFGVAQNNTQQVSLGIGFYSATTSGMPASIAFSQLNGNDPKAQLPPVIQFASSTI